MKCAWLTESPFTSHLTRPFSYHAHRFDTLQRPPRALKRPVNPGQPDSFLDRSVILFDDIIEVLALAENNPSRERAVRFQRFHRSRIAEVLVHVDHPWHRISRGLNSLTQEAFGSRGIAFGGKQKRDCL